MLKPTKMLDRWEIYHFISLVQRSHAISLREKNGETNFPSSWLVELRYKALMTTYVIIFHFRLFIATRYNRWLLYTKNHMQQDSFSLLRSQTLVCLHCMPLVAAYDVIWEMGAIIFLSICSCGYMTTNSSQWICRCYLYTLCVIKECIVKC